MRKYINIVEGRDRNIGNYTPEQARQIGSCAIIAMSNVTGLSWDDVWAVAKSRFSRTGLTPIDEYYIMDQLGYKMETYYPIMAKFDKTKMDMVHKNVRQAEKWLQENDPDIKLICSIKVDGMPHSIAFVGGQFHNVLGAYKARINIAYRVTKK